MRSKCMLRSALRDFDTSACPSRSADGKYQRRYLGDSAPIRVQLYVEGARGALGARFAVEASR